MFWKIAARNLILHRRRSLITGLSICFGFMGVVLLGGYMLRMEHYLATQGIYLNHVGHISIYKKDGLDRHLADPGKFNLNQDDQAKVMAAVASLKEQPEFIGKSLHGQGLITNGCNSFPFMALGVDPATELKTRTHPEVQLRVPELAQLKKGVGFWNAAPVAHDDRIVIAYRLAKLLDKPIVAGDPKENAAAMNAVALDCTNTTVHETIRSHSGVQMVGQTFAGGLAAADSRIAGHFTTGMALSDDSALLLPLASAQQFFDTDDVTFISLYLKPDSSTSNTLNELKGALAKSGTDFDVYSYRDERVNPYFVGAMSFVYVMNAFFLLLVCTVIALSILNAMQISFLERKVEIGTLRALGFRSSHVTGLFLREVVLLSVISLVVGAAIATLIASVINARNIRFAIPGAADDLQFLLQPDLWFCALTGAIFLIVSAIACVLICRLRLRDSVVSLLEQA